MRREREHAAEHDGQQRERAEEVGPRRHLLLKQPRVQVVLLKVLRTTPVAISKTEIFGESPLTTPAIIPPWVCVFALFLYADRLISSNLLVVVLAPVKLVAL